MPSPFLHLKRCFAWQLKGVEPSSHEREKIPTASGHLVPSYLVWRRSAMLISLLFLLPSAIIGIYQFARFFKEEAAIREYLTRAGVLLGYGPTFALLLLFVQVLDALFNWHDWDKSSTHLRNGWLFTIVLSFIPAFVPIQYKLKTELTGIDLWAEQVYAVLLYTKELLPFIITFPASLMRGALRIRGLIPFPLSSLAGWIIIMTAPFQSLFVLFSFAMIMQLNASITLIVATLLMIIAPWLYFFRRELYIGPLNEETEKQIVVNHRIMLVLTVSSMILVIFWVISANFFDMRLIGENEEECIVTYSSLVPLILECIGRLFITTVLFADFILVCSGANWLLREHVEHNQDEATRNEIKDEVRPIFALIGWEMPDQV